MARKMARAKRRPGRTIERAAPATSVDEVLELAEALAELEPTCSTVCAVGAGAAAADVEEHLLEVSDRAQEVLEVWPDAEGTGELRTLLLEMVERAEEDARRWKELGRRLKGLGEEGAHVHVVDGEVVAFEGPHLFDAEAIEIPYRE